MKNIIPIFSVSEIDHNHNHNHDQDVISNTNVVANQNSFMRMRGLKYITLFAAIAFASLVLLSSFSFSPLLQASYSFSSDSQVTHKENELEKILENASMENKTVILTTLNAAWAKPNSMLDLFVESIRTGIDTEQFLKHVVMICMDDIAFARCSSSHPHCYQLRTDGTNFMNAASYNTKNYLKMMWVRIKFLATVLEMGYSFVFTDTDIMWLRNPFQRLFDDVDFQIACDNFNGNSSDRHNPINGGFKYVKSNARTIVFYNYWYKAREFHPGHDQDVLNAIKFEPFIDQIGMTFKLLDTNYFGGFCQVSRDPNVVCTMHANCCIGLENKYNDLAILLQDWKRFTSSKPSSNPSSPWTVPKFCK